MTSSSESWVVFFKEAGIPSASAKNYGTIFDDNRITKEMLLDLDKDILKEMGITIVGDIIAILKHAKKVYSKELKKKDSPNLSLTRKSLVKVSPITHDTATPASTSTITSSKHQTESTVTKVTQSISPQAPPKQEAWQDKPLDTISTDVQYTTATYKNQQQIVGTATSGSSLKHHEDHPRNSDIPPYGASLHSDKIIAPATNILEEYTTSTYEERMKKKRSSSGIDHTSIVSRVTIPQQSSTTISSPPSKATRVVILPQEKRPNQSSSAGDRSKRLLEAAGVIDSSDNFAVPNRRHSTPSNSTSSVFSRLELSSNRSSPVIIKKTPPSSDIKSRLGKRIASKSEADLSNKVSTSPDYPQLYSEMVKDYNKRSKIQDRLGPKDIDSEETIQASPLPGERSMVADSVSRHSDVHARLRKKGLPLPSAPTGPLGKRLGQHAVFGRLE